MHGACYAANRGPRGGTAANAAPMDRSTHTACCGPDCGTLGAAPGNLIVRFSDVGIGRQLHALVDVTLRIRITDTFEVRIGIQDRALGGRASRHRSHCGQHHPL
jgi:hypothetical protein